MLTNYWISRSTVYSGLDLFATGPHIAILIKGNIKEGPREKKK